MKEAKAKELQNAALVEEAEATASDETLPVGSGDEASLASDGESSPPSTITDVGTQEPAQNDTETFAADVKEAAKPKAEPSETDKAEQKAGQETSSPTK